MLRKQVVPLHHQQHHGALEDENNGGTGGSVVQDHQPPFLTLEETTVVSDGVAITITTTDLIQQQQQQQQLQQQQHLQHQLSSSNMENDDYESAYEDDDDNKKDKRRHSNKHKINNLWSSLQKVSWSSHFSVKKIISYVMFGLLFSIVWDALVTPPERRFWISTDRTDVFLIWVQNNPLRGLLAITLVIAAAVVVLIPIGTPLTLGCGYIYKGAYGWKLGLLIATLVSMGGSALGAVVCFLLGRYLFRDRVRLWARNKYPLFDAIDAAAAEHGLRIMAMLYLTPILPLGPVSYMCGTTSMALSSFVLAKIASLPLMLLYCFIGASTRTLLSNAGPGQLNDQFKSIENNETLIVLGIILSGVMIAGITTYIRKELNKILERQEKHQEKHKEKTVESGTVSTQYVSSEEEQPSSMELGSRNITARKRTS